MRMFYVCIALVLANGIRNQTFEPLKKWERNTSTTANKFGHMRVLTVKYQHVSRTLRKFNEYQRIFCAIHPQLRNPKRQWDQALSYKRIGAFNCKQR